MTKRNLKFILGGAGIAVVSSLTTLASLHASDTLAPLVLPRQADQATYAESKYYTPAAATRTATATGVNLDFTQAAEQTINGVVSIKNYATPHYGRQSQGGGFFDDPFFEFFFGPQQRRQPRQDEPDRNDESAQVQQGLGSGVIITADGYIVTNNHVVDGADRLEVTLNDNRSFNATLVGTDPATDLALIKIDAKELPVIPMGDSDNLKVGEWVLAVGNPFGFTSTVTTGIVSAKARSISASTRSPRGGMGIESYIQTDAAVNPGNSGGALVNLKGELVGINTAIYSQTGNYAGYSFAVPTSLVKKVVGDIREFGAVQRAVLGVSITELTSKRAKDEDITAVSEGVYVTDVNDRSAALEAGITKGDVIIEVAGIPVKNVAQLQEQVSRHRPGDKVTIKLIRDNKPRTLEVTLRNTRGNTAVVSTASALADLGCAFTPLSDNERKELGIKSGGIKVTGIKAGPFKEAGVKDGFVIIKINDIKVSSVDDVERVFKGLTDASNADRVMFLTGLYPTGRPGYYAVPLSD